MPNDLLRRFLVLRRSQKETQTNCYRLSDKNPRRAAGFLRVDVGRNGGPSEPARPARPQEFGTWSVQPILGCKNTAIAVPNMFVCYPLSLSILSSSHYPSYYFSGSWRWISPCYRHVSDSSVWDSRTKHGSYCRCGDNHQCQHIHQLGGAHHSTFLWE